jgi:hypothetical protein
MMNMSDFSPLTGAPISVHPQAQPPDITLQLSEPVCGPIRVFVTLPETMAALSESFQRESSPTRAEEARAFSGWQYFKFRAGMIVAFCLIVVDAARYIFSDGEEAIGWVTPETRTKVRFALSTIMAVVFVAFLIWAAVTGNITAGYG